MDKTIIKKIGINGEGIGYLNRKPVFIDHALLGETVEFETVQTFPGYAKGKLINVVSASKQRIKPACPFYNQCGGCSLMHVNLNTQIRMKQDILNESLLKYAHISRSTPPFILNAHPLGYRNQLKMPFMLVDGKVTTGFYKRDSNFFVPIDHCIIHDTLLETFREKITQLCNQYRLPVYTKEKEGLRYLVLRQLSNRTQCTFVTSKIELPEEFVTAVAQLGVFSIHQSINTKVKSPDIIMQPLKRLFGKDQMPFQINGLKLQCNPFSFFQLNTYQAAKLYDLVTKGIRPGTLLVEAYSGMGVMSLLAASKFKEVIGFDTNPASIKNAEENARMNGIGNVTFKVGDSAEQLKRISKQRQVDTLIVDPPRAGLDEAMIETLIRGKIKNVVYISCNPSTLAKNLAALEKKYSVISIQPLDMFSQTAHIECVVVLTRK